VKYVLTQPEKQYKYLAIQEEFRGVLNFMQSTDMTFNSYYKKLVNKVEIAKQAGCVFYTPVLLQMETDDLYPGRLHTDFTDPEQVRVRAIAKEKFLAVLFLGRSDAKKLNLKDKVKNDHAKGVTVQQDMQLMRDYCLVKTVATLPPGQGTTFAG
jgi:hypothetical protein